MEGLIKCGLQQSQQNQQPCNCHWKVDGEGSPWDKRNNYVRKAGNGKKRLRDIDLEKNPHRWPTGLLAGFVVATLYVEVKWKVVQNGCQG